MIAVFRKKVQNGITVTASAKFCHRNSVGNRVGGNCASSSGVLSAEMSIQYSGRENRMSTMSITRRDIQVPTGP